MKGSKTWQLLFGDPLSHHLGIAPAPATRNLDADVAPSTHIRGAEPAPAFGKVRLHCFPIYRWPMLLCQIVLVERLTHQRFDDRLSAHIKTFGGAVQFFQHPGGDIHVDSLNRLCGLGVNHAALPFVK